MMALPIPRAPDGAAPWPSAPGWLPLDEPAIANILAIDDAAVRNVWITQSYADLGRRLLDVLDTDQTWCTFAIWASDTAGVSIRGAELPHIFDALLHGADDHVDAAVERANDHPTFVERLGLVGRFGRATSTNSSAQRWGRSASSSPTGTRWCTPSWRRCSSASSSRSNRAQRQMAPTTTKSMRF